MKNNLFSKKGLSLIFSLVAALSLLAAAVTPAFALSTDPASMSGAKTDPKAEAMFHHAITVYNATVRSRMFENNSLDAALQYVHSRQNGLSGGGGRGYGAFSASQYNALFGNMSQVNTLLALIKSMIVAHPGFDKYGAVVNSSVAYETAKEMDSYARSLQYYSLKANALYSTLQHTR